MADAFVYLNGRIVPAEQACVNVFDTGLLHGASVFTTMLAHHGRVFRLDRHLRRLLDNAERIALHHGAGAAALAGAVQQVLAANALAEARVRITLTPGPVAGPPSPTTIVTAGRVDNVPAWYEKGLTVTVCGVRQFTGDVLAGIKTGCYLGRMLARQAAATRGADESLWFTEAGHLAEACFCNVFLVGGGTVRTPPLSTPVLPGIVREAVLELCGGLGLPCRDDQPIPGPEVLSAEEVFLTSSVAGIRPVVRLDRQAVGDERPGPVTRRVMAAYADLLERECPPGQPARKGP